MFIPSIFAYGMILLAAMFPFWIFIGAYFSNSAWRDWCFKQGYCYYHKQTGEIVYLDKDFQKVIFKRGDVWLCDEIGRTDRLGYLEYDTGSRELDIQ